MRAIALGFFVSSTAAFVQFPQFPAPARCIPRVLSAAPVAQGGAFGMDPREIKVLRYGFEQNPLIITIHSSRILCFAARG